MYYIGIDLGGTNIAIGLVSEDGNLIVKKSVPTGAERPFDLIVLDMVNLINELAKEQGISIDDIKSIGVGSPGFLSTAEGKLIYANNFTFGKDVPIRALLQKYFDKPIYLGNDANVAALGESISGSAKGHDSAVMITLGTGVGGGIIIDGKIYEGYRSAGAEIGHILLMHNGEPCSCGRKGCWEAYASAPALIRQTKAAMEKYPESKLHAFAEKEGKVSGRTAFNAARAGDEVALKVVEQYCEYVAEGLIDIVNVFRPEVIILGGGISNEGQYLIDKLRNFININAYGNKIHPEQEIVIASLGNDAGIIGAALLGR